MFKVIYFFKMFYILCYIGEREAYMEALRSFLINEFDMIKIERLGKPDFALKESGIILQNIW